MWQITLMAFVPSTKAVLKVLAAGPSLEARTGCVGEHIDIASDVWMFRASYSLKQPSKQH